MRKINIKEANNILASMGYELNTRELASEILGQSEFYGEFYYQMEDWLTGYLSGETEDIPRGIEGEYLKCALRIEVRDFFDNFDAEDIESDDIEAVVERIFYHSSHNVLDMDFIEDEVHSYLDEREV